MTEVIPLKSIENYEFLDEILDRVNTALQDFPEFDYVYVGVGNGVNTDNKLIMFNIWVPNIWNKDGPPTYFDVYCKLSDLIEKRNPCAPAGLYTPYFEIVALSRIESVTLDVNWLPETNKIIEAPIHDKIPELARKSLKIQKRGGFYRSELWKMIGVEECKYLGEHKWMRKDYKTVGMKAVCTRCGLRKSWRELNHDELGQFMAQQIKS